MQVTIVLEDMNSNLDYFEFDLDKEFKEAKAFYLNHMEEVFEIRANELNGYYDLVNEDIFKRIRVNQSVFEKFIIEGYRG